VKMGKRSRLAFPCGAGREPLSVPVEALAQIGAVPTLAPT
jgi:hypothetical protein